MAFEDDDTDTYLVLINDEAQYSLWPRRLTIPQGWKHTGFEGAKVDCVRHVDEVWTDMRPQSLRDAMAEGERVRAP